MTYLFSIAPREYILFTEDLSKTMQNYTMVKK